MGLNFPADVVVHVGGAARDEARFAANCVKIKGRNVLAMLANDVAVGVMMQAFAIAGQQWKEEGDTSRLEGMEMTIHNIAIAMGTVST